MFQIIGTGTELRVVVSPRTTGSYRCVASVRERVLQFPDLVGRMRVLVKGPPKIVSSGEQLGTPGTTVNLECNTVSVPRPIKVTWTYKGRPVDLGEPPLLLSSSICVGGKNNFNISGFIALK